MNRKKELPYFILLCIVIISIPFLIKRCDLKGGSIVTTATIVGIVSCPKMSTCIKYDYLHKGKLYQGEDFKKKGQEIGSVIKIEISIKKPEISYVIWEKR